MIYPDCDLNRWCVEPSSYIADADNYYTKSQVDEKIEEIGCCITEEEVDEKISAATSGLQETLVAGDNISISGNVISAEVPSLSGYATEQWVLDKHYITGVDLSDYVTFEDLPELNYYASKEWVINQNFAYNSEVIQYITNLQNQIDSLKELVSGCCGSQSGETEYRWLTITGENDYTCSGTTKYTKEKEQSSTDGINWVDTGNYRSGSTVLEQNSTDCGYITGFKLKANYTIVSITKVGQVDCDSSTTLTSGEVKTYIASPSFFTSIEIGDCIDTIGGKALANTAMLTQVDIPSNIKTLEYGAFAFCNATAYTLHEGLETIGNHAFAYNDFQSFTIPNSVKTIDNGAFSYCTSLKSITIGSGVTSIGDAVFEDANSLESVTILATTPPSVTRQLFFGNTTNCPIYVPSSSVNAYKSAEGWSTYADRIQAIT